MSRKTDENIKKFNKKLKKAKTKIQNQKDERADRLKEITRIANTKKD